jgi:GGDEF domain-containing protein
MTIPEFNNWYKKTLKIINDIKAQLIYDNDEENFVKESLNHHFSKEIAEKIYKLGKEIFQTTLEEFNALEEKPFNLSIAYGCAYYDTVGKYTSLDEVLKASDEHMYKHKQVLKSKQTT